MGSGMNVTGIVQLPFCNEVEVLLLLMRRIYPYIKRESNIYKDFSFKDKILIYNIVI